MTHTSGGRAVVRRAMTTLALTLLCFPATSRPALAHGFGQRYDLPVPLWLYLYGAGAAVLLSFVVFGFFVGERGAPRGYPRLNLLRFGAFRAAFAGRPFLSGIRLVSVALFLLVIVSGLFGDQSSQLNFAPTFVWVIWWVGFTLAVAFIGNLWALVNPWRILFEWADALARRLGVEDGLEANVPYPASLDVWPALFFFFAFAWVELVFWGAATPRNIAFLVFVYSSVTWLGMSVFGKETWLRKGEAFSVFFDTLAKFAPTEARVSDRRFCKECNVCRSRDGADDGGCVNCYGCFVRSAPEQRELNLRSPAVGLLRLEGASAGRLLFVIFMLASVTYDGLLATPPWVSLVFFLSSVAGSFGVLSSVFYGTLGLVAVPLLFLALYAGFVKLCQLLGGGADFRRLAAAFAYSLVPIALAYQTAHYYTLLLTQGRNILFLVSDPFGWGWDLFGTAEYEPNAGVVGAVFVWYSQVALIVAGHVVAVYLAHATAMRFSTTPKLALRSQIPMVTLMVLYTVLSLWILSQPIVE